MCTSIHHTFERIGRTIESFACDWHRSQRMLLGVQIDPERFVFRPSAIPDTYSDFLFVTAGALPHEPSARERARAAAGGKSRLR